MSAIINQGNSLILPGGNWLESQASLIQSPAIRPTVTVIVPTLNEAQNLPLVLPFIPMDWVDEVLLVDGRSTDNTIEVARKLLPSIKVILEKTPGKGAAMRAGYAAATSDILIVLDADGSNDPREIPRFVRALMEGSDMVKGSRFAHGGGTTDMPRIRKLGNGAFVQIVNLLFGTHFTELCYGYHAFWRHCLDQIDLTYVNGFEIDTSLYLKALKAQLRITEVPSFEGYRFHGHGNLRTIPDGWRVLKTIMKEYTSAIGAPHQKPYLGFRGQKPVQEPFSMTAALPWNTRFLQNLEYFKMLQMALATGGYQRWMIPYFLQLTSQTVGADSGSAFLLDEFGNVSDGFVVYDGTLQPVSPSDLTECVQHGLAGWAIRNRAPVLVESTANDPRWLRRPYDVNSETSRSAISFPITTGDRVMAVLTLVRPQDKHFTEQELDLFRDVSQVEDLNLAQPDCLR